MQKEESCEEDSGNLPPVISITNCEIYEVYKINDKQVGDVLLISGDEGALFHFKYTGQTKEARVNKITVKNLLFKLQGKGIIFLGIGGESIMVGKTKIESVESKENENWIVVYKEKNFCLCKQ